jgi:hypothetical protein
MGFLARREVQAFKTFIGNQLTFSALLARHIGEVCQQQQ